MKIAYYNPYVNSAENQIFASMQEAGRKIGLTLAECADDRAIDAFDPEFVLSVTAQVPKVTHHPTYLAMHEPKASIFSYDAKFPNILSYDGYLTISDTLVRFIRDFTFGVGRSEDPGFFYLTPQRLDLAVDWDRIAGSGGLRMAYFGTNWESRMPRLLDRLDGMGVLRIHGPRAAWEARNHRGYCGPVPFDGRGPQGVYAECGAGLVLLDSKWQAEDIISNRIFEIASVGALAICPDIPWIRKWFGDSVLYFHPDAPPADIARKIGADLEACNAAPERARAMADRARQIFEQDFTAERMLQNLVAYHRRKQAEAGTRLAEIGPAPQISVVVRCGGRPVDSVRRAVGSITRQTYGRFHIILARYRDIDLSAIRHEAEAAGCSVQEIPIEGGGRAATLFGALRRVETEYFAVLDDDDMLMPDHFEHLFAAGRRSSERFDVAFSGTMDTGVAVDLGAHTPCNRVISRFGYTAPVRDAWDLLAPIHLGSLVARTDLLTPALLQTPDMKTAEDSVLVATVSRRSRPVFSYKPTFLYAVASEGHSNWRHDPDRQMDEISLAIRCGLALAPSWSSDAPSISPHIRNRAGPQTPPPVAVPVPPVSEIIPSPASPPQRPFWFQVLRRPSVLLGPLAPRWRALKARRRARRQDDGAAR